MPGMPESSFAAVGVVEGVGFDHLDLGEGGDDHLGDAHAAVDGERLLAKVDQGDHDLAAIVGVNGAGGIDQRDAVAAGEAGARADLGFIAGGEGHVEAAGDELDLAGG